MRKYKQIGNLKIAVGKEKGSYYLVPTICISPKQVEWLDDRQKWDNSHYICVVYFEWLCFYLEFDIRRRKK